MIKKAKNPAVILLDQESLKLFTAEQFDFDPKFSDQLVSNYRGLTITVPVMSVGETIRVV